MIEKFLKTKITLNCPNDLNEKWDKWIEELNDIPNKINIIKEELTNFGKIIDFTFDSTFNTEIYTRLYYSNLSISKKSPLIVFFHGSLSPMDKTWTKEDCLKWVEDGFSVVIFDARNQGGNTIDKNKFTYQNEYYINQGIDNLETNYCKRLYLDGIKIVDLIKDQNIELFDSFHNVPLIALGGSQGGEMALAVSALTNKIDLCVPDIPSGCAIKERIINHFGKYNAVNDLKEKVPTLDMEKIYFEMGYFDIINFISEIKCPIFSGVGFNDDVCPPEYFYIAFSKAKVSKTLYIYNGYGHGGFDNLHYPKKLKFIKEYFKID